MYKNKVKYTPELNSHINSLQNMKCAKLEVGMSRGKKAYSDLCEWDGEKVLRQHNYTEKRDSGRSIILHRTVTQIPIR